MTTLIIDLSIIAIIVFCTWRGYKNGLIRGVFGVVTLIVALIIANIVAAAYADDITDVMQPFVGGVVDSTINEIIDDDEIEYEPIDHEIDTTEFKIAYTALRRIGLPEASAVNISEYAAGAVAEASLIDLVSDKLTSLLAYVALFGIAFLLIAIVFAVIGNLISFVFSLPGLKLIDTIAGIAFGFIKGFIIVLTLAAIVRYFGLLAISTVEKTSVLKFFVNNNMIANILGI